MTKSLAIEREFGSGGREIGKMVAEMANIPYYDGNLMVKVAKEKGISLDLLNEYDEKNTGSFLYNIALFASYNQGANQSKIYELYYEVQKAIKDLAKTGPAVFVGRSSTEILKDSGRSVSVYIYSSDPAAKLKRAMQTEGITEAEAKKLMERKDRQRSDYFKYWTEKNWKDRGNYDMELNTSTLSSEECARILLRAMGVD